jgi:transcription elongation factor B subunit 2
VYKKEDGEWETLEIAALSSPPELPDVMKPQEPTPHVEQQAA